MQSGACLRLVAKGNAGVRTAFSFVYLVHGIYGQSWGARWTKNIGCKMVHGSAHQCGIATPTDKLESDGRRVQYIGCNSKLKWLQLRLQPGVAWAKFTKAFALKASLPD